MSGKQIVISRREVESAVVSPVVAPGAQRKRTTQRDRADDDLSYREIGRLIHTSLRGRYWQALVLIAIFGSAAVVAAAWLIRPKYHSEALLRIAYTMPQVLQETDQNGPLAMFDAFISSQTILITSRRVIDIAIKDPAWKNVVREFPKDPDRYFAENLKVEVKPRSEFIQVSFIDRDPATAAAAVNATINAYSEVYNSQEKQVEQQRVVVLEDTQKTLQGKIDELTSQIKVGAEGHGIAALDQFYDAAAARLVKLDGALADVRLAIATSSEHPAATQSAPLVDASHLTPSQIAQSDPIMHGYLQEQVRCERELVRLTQQFGEKHPKVAQARLALDDASARTDSYAANTAGKSLSALKSDEANLEKLRVQAQQGMLSLGDKKHDMLAKEQELRTLRDQVSEMSKRIEVLRAEGSLGGRLSVISKGEIPISPEKDRRLVFIAAAGGAGGLFPVAIMVLLSLLSRHNYRDSEETEVDTMLQAPLLGILPQLSDAPPESETELVLGAAYGMHQIRVALGSLRQSSDPQIYLVTSAAAGEGKTSLTMSLGLSFASCRMRTLIIDCDLIGRKLTRNLEANDFPGLTEAIDAGSMRQFTRKLAANLTVLTTGDRSTQAASTLPVSGIRTLLEEARRNYDVILIDSGPILGCIEAAVVAQEVDGTILAISRGQQRGMVAKAVRRLNLIGAHITGMVFNRARPEDYARSPYSSSSRSANPDLPIKPMPAPRAVLARFGPIVQAVAADVFVTSG